VRFLRSPLRVLVCAGLGMGGFALWRGLSDGIPPTLTLPGGRVVWLGPAMMAFLLPVALAAIDALLRNLCVKHPVDDPDGTNLVATSDAIMLRVAAFVTGVHAMVLAAALGWLSGRAWAGRIVPLMLGLTMIAVGNLLPKTRRNLAVGIRTRGTLADRRLWIRTHRSSAYLVVGLGTVIVVAAVAVPAPFGPGMILVAGPVALVGICLVVRQSRRRLHA
jgi:hypothetical protein